MRCVEVSENLFGYPVKTRTADTLCAIYLIIICQGWIGTQNDLHTSHGEVIALILCAVISNDWRPADNFEAEMFTTLCMPVILESFFNPRIQLNPWFWKLTTTYEPPRRITDDESAPIQSLKLQSLCRIPDLILQPARKLTVPETLEQEGFSSTKSCMQGCIIYLYHIVDPLGHQTQNEEVIAAISDILEIAKETPEGFGLEIGLYWGLFMAGVAILNDTVAEDLVRHKLKSDTSVSIYHAARALELLEVLWKRQHQYGKKYDWRQVQIQMGIQAFILLERPRSTGGLKAAVACQNW